MSLLVIPLVLLTIKGPVKPAADVGLADFSQGLDTAAKGMAAWAGSIAFWGGIGWALDAAQSHRGPIYRASAPAPAPRKPGLSLAFRF